MRWWIFVVIFALASTAFAQGTSEKRRQALAELYREYTVCIVYYNMQKVCAPSDMKPRVTHDLDPIIKELIENAHEVGLRAGMTEEAMIARLDKSHDEANKRVEHSCLKFIGEFDRNGDRCKMVGEHPDAIFYEYLNK